MTEWNNRSRYIEIALEVGTPLKRFARPEGKYQRTFEETLQKHMQLLLENLAIPAEVLIEVESQVGRQALPDNSYNVSINGQTCRRPLPTSVPDNVDAPALASSVFQVIHQNRELILSLPLTISIRRAWAKERGEAWLPWLEDEQVQEYLAMLIAHGLNIDRAKEFIGGWTTNKAVDQPPQELFELTAAGLDKVALKAWLGEAQYLFVKEPGKDNGPSASPGEETLAGMLEMMRDGLFYELGLMLPKVDIQRDARLEDSSFRFQFNDLQFPPLPGLLKNEFLVNDTTERLALLKITSRKVLNPANGSECAVVSEHNQGGERCEKAGLTTWSPTGYFVLALSAAVRSNAHLFMNADVARFQMRRLGEAFPSLINAAEHLFAIHDITRILRCLLEEQLSIRDLRGILESLLATTGSGDKKLISNWLSDGQKAARLGLKGTISHKYSRGGKSIVVILLDHAIEARLMESRPLHAREHHRLLNSVYREIRKLHPTAQSPCILTRIECRNQFRNMIAREFPQAVVLCYQDLSPDMNIQPIGRIAWQR